MDLKYKFPLFDLKIHNNLVIMSGGGGDAIYGKKNGIIVCSSELKPIYFLELDNIVEKVEICYDIDISEIDEFLSELNNDISKDNSIKSGKSVTSSPSNKSSKSSKSSLSSKSSKSKETSNESKGKIRENSKEKVNSRKEPSGAKISKKNGNIETFYFLAIGLTKYYLIEFKNNIMQIIFENNQRLENVFCKSYIYHIKEQNLIKSNLSIKENQTLEQNVSTYYFKENTIQPIQNNIINFKNKTYRFDEEICNISLFSNDLVFYLKNSNTTTHLVFIGDKIEKIKIDKITCLSVYKNKVVLGNVEGKIFLYENNRKKKILNAYHLPITGVAFCDGYVYFCSFDGYFGRKKVYRGRISFFLFALFVAIVAVFLHFFLEN